MFVGDDMRRAWAQHEEYPAALATLIRENRRDFLTACTITGGDTSRWPETVAIDHRTLQDAHDLAAGAWRWRSNPPQGRLPFRDQQIMVVTGG